ncbi:MAG: murein hydrolase activator NlpD [Sodalis sp. Psp]|nr:murein hydrolase activator NlpD [Sodalis sp. Psp]MCR3756777.1 murein hydrolase activator NlpD [Sodalis sp. Ppy]
MGSPKYAWRHAVICAVASVWMAGCANNESIAPISSVSDNNSGGSSGKVSAQSNTLTVKCTPQIVRPHTETTTIDQINTSHKENFYYKRSYKTIQKGCYSGTTYQVKRGDTLFYIAWITSNNYRDLAKENNIQEPYRLNVGQILQVSMTPIAGSVPSETILTSNVNKASKASVSSVNTQLTKLSVAPSKNNNYSESSRQNTQKMLSSSSTVVTTTGPVAVSSTWRWPTNGKIVNNFSYAEGGNKGVDVSGLQGQPILATASGRVVYAGNALRGYGNLIIIKHNDDYLSAYAHNDKMLVFEQQEVRSGQKIATMGSTGTNSTKLHFEIRYKGKPVNPLRYLPP